MSNIASKIFIAHASDDYESALFLKNILEPKGIECWLFENDIHHGESISDNILAAIEQCDTLIVCLSQSALTSRWISWEIGYSVDLQRERGCLRPIIVGVDVSNDDIQGYKIQPVKFLTNEPLGPVFDFSKHRIHKLQDMRFFEKFADSLIPQITRISDIRGKHKKLFDGILRLWEGIFVDPFDRPDASEVADWLENEKWNYSSLRWFEVWFAAHYGDQIVGMLNITYHKDHAYAFRPFLGITPEWDTHYRLQWLINETTKIFSQIHPNYLGMISEADIIDFSGLEKFDVEGISVTGPSDQLLQAKNSLREMKIRQNMGYLTLCDDMGQPVKITQPSLRLPLSSETERQHYLMFQPNKFGFVPVFDEPFMDLYYDRLVAGFGKEGANLPNYESYILGFRSGQNQFFNSNAEFRKIYLNPKLNRLAKREEPELALKLAANVQQQKDQHTSNIERIERRLRSLIEIKLEGKIEKIPSDINDKIKLKIQREISKRGIGNYENYKAFPKYIEYADLMELKAIILNKIIWTSFLSVFSNKETTEAKFGQLGAFRNALAHNRTPEPDITYEGLAAIHWFWQALQVL